MAETEFHDDIFPPLSFSIPLEIDEDDDDSCMLGPGVLNSPDEKDQPRSVIAEHVKNWRLIGELKRPLLLGTFEGQLAYLLVFKFTFQRLCSNSILRVRSSVIEIEFEDAPTDPAAAPSLAHCPQVVAIYPKWYEGPTSYATVQRGISLSVTVPGGAGIQGTVSRKTERLEEGRTSVHGVIGPRPSNCVDWSITENKVLRDGLPGEFELALVTKYNEGRRFSATVTVWVSFGWNIFGGKMRVMGKNDDPLFFNPGVLNRLCSNTDQLALGPKMIVNLGCLDEVELEPYVHIRL